MWSSAITTPGGLCVMTLGMMTMLVLFVTRWDSLQTGARAFSRAFFGRGSDPILLDQVNCTGTESRLADCPANSIGVHDCGHYEDAGVRCISGMLFKLQGSLCIYRPPALHGWSSVCMHISSFSGNLPDSNSILHKAKGTIDSFPFHSFLYQRCFIVKLSVPC